MTSERYYIIIWCASCDGGIRIARVDYPETPDDVAARYGGIIQDYGPYTREAALRAAEALRQSITPITEMIS